MYKDPDKQREADKERQRRYRAWKASGGVTQGVTDSGCDKQGVTSPMLDELKAEGIRKQEYKEEKLDLIKTLAMKDTGDKPDVSVVMAYNRTIARLDNEKRGKDIKCFEDLPPDVQQTINSMSMVDSKIDQTIKVNRTAIAIHYQHLFPDRFHSTGVAI